MKKLTLTFCAMFALFVVAPALFADGPEKYSGKEKEVMQPAPPVCDFYRAHEWDLDIWGAYAFAADTGRFDVPHDDPFLSSINGGHLVPDQDPTDINGNEPQLTNPDERVNIGQVTKNELFARDDVWGGGVDAKYFWSRYFGAGIEAVGLAAKRNFAGGGLATLTGRYPFGRFAPYLTGGLGFIDGGATMFEFFKEEHTYTAGFVTHEQERFLTDPVANHHARALGQIGVGLEYRLTCHIGLMSDFTWNFVFGQENHGDKFRAVTEQATTFVDDEPAVIVSTARNLIPGHNSDNQDFGMARFGVTFSY